MKNVCFDKLSMKKKMRLKAGDRVCEVDLETEACPNPLAPEPVEGCRCIAPDHDFLD